MSNWINRGPYTVATDAKPDETGHRWERLYFHRGDRRSHGDLSGEPLRYLVGVRCADCHRLPLDLLLVGGGFAGCPGSEGAPA